MTERDDNRDRIDHLLDLAGGVDVGEGYTLAWNVDPDGALWPVLVDQRQHEAQFVPNAAEHFRDLAPHELTGKLPDSFRQFRCGAPTRSGKPCRTSVDRPLARCHRHAEAPASKPAPRAAAAEPALFDLEAEGDR